MTRRRRHFSPEEKLRLINRIHARRGSTSVSDACANVGIKRNDYYRWQRAFANGGKEAFVEKSRKPKKLARATPDTIKSKIRAMAKSGEYANPTRICEHLRAAGSRITPKTVISILEDAGLYGFISKTRKNGRVIRRKGILNSA